jgi:cyclopropane-fatty-acyl-phospholipid synthase
MDNIASGPQNIDRTEGNAPAAQAVEGGSWEARLLRRVLRAMHDPPMEFLLEWSGERVAPRAHKPIAHVRLADRRALWRLLRDPQVTLGDAYSAGSVDMDCELVQFLDVLYRGELQGGEAPRMPERTRSVRRYSPRRNTLAGSRDNIHRHYDIGNDFYSLWLGQTMAYTCAYYPSEAASLDEAQVAKMDHVCRKLRLRAGESVVEAGCGWGGLAMHMAQHYGVKVRAFNISHEQIAFARGRLAERGLSDRVEFVEDDYRNITGRYDVFVSVGMLEHVGPENYREFGRVARRSLHPQGRGLLHSIGRNWPGPLHPWVEQRIFPGAYPPSLAEMMDIFEPSDLSVLDVENLRLHYARTLKHWLELYEAAVPRVRAMFDDIFVRKWRLYLAGSFAAFQTGTLQLFQVLFSTAQNNDLPLTREFMYPR